MASRLAAWAAISLKSEPTKFLQPYSYCIPYCQSLSDPSTSTPSSCSSQLVSHSDEPPTRPRLARRVPLQINGLDTQEMFAFSRTVTLPTSQTSSQTKSVHEESEVKNGSGCHGLLEDNEIHYKQGGFATSMSVPGRISVFYDHLQSNEVDLDLTISM